MPGFLARIIPWRGTGRSVLTPGSFSGLFYQLYDIIHDNWTFSRHDQAFKTRMTGNRASNDGDLVRRWCVAGKGLAVKSCLDMSSDLLSGNVVSVMPDFKPRSTELWLVCPSRQSITPAVRLLRDDFKEKCTAILKQLIEKGILDKSVLSQDLKENWTVGKANKQMLDKTASRPPQTDG